MPKASTDGYYEALWPRSPRQVQLKPLAKRLASLEGKTIAQLWDFVFRGDEREVVAALPRRFRDICSDSAPAEARKFISPCSLPL